MPWAWSNGRVTGVARVTPSEADGNRLARGVTPETYPPPADSPVRRSRDVVAEMACASCGLVYTSDPKDPECPLCHSQEVERVR